MQIQKLDHVNIQTPHLADTLRFYEDVLGLKAGPTPGGTDTSRAAWVYDKNGFPILHIGQIIAERRLPGDRPSDIETRPTRGGGVVHHVAFEGSGHDQFVEKLTELGVSFDRNEIPSINLRQIFLRDPNDILIELNFR
jgi:catechol 2,3-dioxygenase-like lactoylglutathione lyase family enzyme